MPQGFVEEQRTPLPMLNLGERRFRVSQFLILSYYKFASFNEKPIIKKTLGAYYVPSVLVGSMGN